MYLVLDTTETYDNYHLSDGVTTTLRQLGVRLNLWIAVPQVVIDETKDRFHKELSRLTRSTATIRRLLPWATDRLPDVSVDSELVEYRNHLDQVIKKDSIRVLPYPNVSHQDVVQRIHDGLPPFQTKDHSYKDFLIWSSVLELALDCHEPVYFATKDFSGFFQNGSPHPTLANDFARLGLQPDAVRLVKGRRAFFTDVVKPALQRLDDWEVRLSKGDLPFDLGEYLANNDYELVTEAEDQINITGMASWAAIEIQDFDLTEAIRIDSNRVVITGTISYHAALAVEVYVPGLWPQLEEQYGAILESFSEGIATGTIFMGLSSSFDVYLDESTGLPQKVDFYDTTKR